MISYQEILKLHSLTKSKLVAGKTGLDRMVRWVHFIDLPDVIPWVQGGELLIITGIGLEGDKRRLTKLVKEIIQKNLAGLIINLGPYIETIPEEVIELADLACFPVFELPWEVKLVEVTQEICSCIVMKHLEERSISDFMEQLLLKPVEDAESLIQRALAFNYDLSSMQQVAIVSLRGLPEYRQKQGITEEQGMIVLKMQLEQQVRMVLVRRGKNCLSMAWMDTLVLLMPSGKKTVEARQNVVILAAVVEALNTQFPDLSVAAGLGKRVKELCDVRQSYLQAHKALRLANFKRNSRPVYVYEQLGIYKLLFDIPLEKLRSYYEEIIEPLHEYDTRYKMDLVSSLFVYFEENGNVVQTAKRLFVHRNTLDYRLKKIEDVTGKNLNDPYDRLTLQLGVIIGKQMTPAILLDDFL